MKTLKITIGIVVVAMSVMTATAQSNNFELELDPIAYALGGASGHVAYTFKNERIQLGYGQLTLPEQMQNHEGITESFRAVSLKWDYFFGKKDASQGFFAGPTFDYMFLTYESDTAKHEESQFNLGIRTGYKFDLFKNSQSLSGIYVTPWIGTSWLTNTDDIELDDQNYSRPAFTFFPTIHLGWSF